MVKKKEKTALFVMLLLLLGGWFVLGQPAAASEDAIFPVEGAGTVNLGKQGLFVSNPPRNVTYVKMERIKPLPAKIIYGIDISYRSPALEINFLNANKAAVRPAQTLTSVFFNVSEPEVKLWETGGSSEIGILYYSPRIKKWQPCPTRYIPKRQGNSDYDRLACIIIDNGFYALGKLAFDPVFPLQFKLQGRELDPEKRVPYD